jgi:hypothetical protein
MMESSPLFFAFMFHSPRNILHVTFLLLKGYNQSTLIDDIKQTMINVQCIRQMGQENDVQHPSRSHIHRMSNDSIRWQSTHFCNSDQFDECETMVQLQRQPLSSIIRTSNGQLIRHLLDIKSRSKKNHLNTHTDWLMIFLASKARLYCQRLKVFESCRYPSLQQWIIVIHCLCSKSMNFYFDEPQVNQFMCDYLDALVVKGMKTIVQIKYANNSMFTSIDFVLFVYFSSYFTRRDISMDDIKIS